MKAWPATSNMFPHPPVQPAAQYGIRGRGRNSIEPDTLKDTERTTLVLPELLRQLLELLVFRVEPVGEVDVPARRGQQQVKKGAL